MKNVVLNLDLWKRFNQLVDCSKCKKQVIVCRTCKENGCECGGKLLDAWDKNPGMMF